MVALNQMTYEKKSYTKKWSGKGNGSNPSPLTPNQGSNPSPLAPNQGSNPSPFTPNQGSNPSPLAPNQGSNPSPFTPNQGSNPSPLTLNREPVVALNRRRGKLAPLMPEEAKAAASIHDLSYDFACRITRLFQYLTEDAEYKEYVQSKQIYRSGTSVGANVRESKHAQSDADFLSKMSIAYKEADESDYWLNLLHDNGFLEDKQYNSLKTILS